MITLDMYWMGRDKTHAAELSDDIRANAQRTVDIVNPLLEAFFLANPTAAHRFVQSGWRPASINAAAGGATRSCHLTGEAVDLSDKDRELARWLIQHPEILERFGLWMERPESTPSWAHLQTRPVAARYFWPSRAGYEQWVAAGAKAFA